MQAILVYILCIFIPSNYSLLPVMVRDFTNVF